MFYWNIFHKITEFLSINLFIFKTSSILEFNGVDAAQCIKASNSEFSFLISLNDLNPFIPSNKGFLVLMIVKSYLYFLNNF